MNVYCFVDSGFGLVWQFPGHYDYFHSNHVIINADGDYGDAANMCDSTGGTVVLYNNTVYSPTGKVTECNMPLAQWQKQGHDQGTTAQSWPQDSALLELIAAALDIKSIKGD